MAKFTNEEIANMNMLYAAGYSYRQLASKYYSNPTTIKKYIKEPRSHLYNLTPLQKLLKDKGIKQEDIKEKLGFTSCGLSKRLHGKIGWNVEEAYKFCEIVGIDFFNNIILFLKENCNEDGTN